jgi:hypothetical protein
MASRADCRAFASEGKPMSAMKLFIALSWLIKPRAADYTNTSGISPSFIVSVGKRITAVRWLIE